MPMPEVNEIVLLGDKKGIVIATWTVSDDEVPDWANEEAWEDVLVAFHEEDEPRSVSLQDLIPDSGPLVIPSIDGHCVGVCSETTGVLYFDLDKYGGQWYASAIWDGGNYGYDKFIDLGPYQSKLDAMRACVDSGFDAISESGWREYWSDECEQIDQELQEDRGRWMGLTRGEKS